jgi:hypothetical protein
MEKETNVPNPVKRKHVYHAEAKALAGDLQLPLVQTVHPFAQALLAPEGGYKSVRSPCYHIEGVVSIQSAYSQVAGNLGTKPDQGWSTVSTAVVEGLNIFEVVTADRVVGQIITEHPLVGYVPKISFLGTRFENLRIAGRPISLDLDLNLLGEVPAKDSPYTLDRGVIDRVSRQYKDIIDEEDLPSDLSKYYQQLTANLGSREAIECSLVKQLEASIPGRCFSHVIRIPGFGTIKLAKLRIEHEDFDGKKGPPKRTYVRLTMIECTLGCAINGRLEVAGPTNNGGTIP